MDFWVLCCWFLFRFGEFCCFVTLGLVGLFVVGVSCGFLFGVVWGWISGVVVGNFGFANY